MVEKIHLRCHGRKITFLNIRSHFIIYYVMRYGRRFIFTQGSSNGHEVESCKVSKQAAKIMTTLTRTCMKTNIKNKDKQKEKCKETSEEN